MATETFPAWLDRMLRERGWTRTRLAERLGHADTRTIRRWLAGQNRPREGELVRLYEVLGEDYSGGVTAGDDPRVSLVDEIAALREDVRRLEQAFRDLSAAREARYDELVAAQARLQQGQAEVVAAVRHAMAEVLATDASDPPTGRTQQGPRGRRAS